MVSRGNIDNKLSQPWKCLMLDTQSKIGVFLFILTPWGARGINVPACHQICIYLDLYLFTKYIVPIWIHLTRLFANKLWKTRNNKEKYDFGVVGLR